MYGLVNWVQASDGYLYFNQLVTKNQKIGLCNEVYMSVQMELKSNEDYIMYFVVESAGTAWEYEAV